MEDESTDEDDDDDGSFPVAVSPFSKHPSLRSGRAAQAEYAIEESEMSYSISASTTAPARHPRTASAFVPASSSGPARVINVSTRSSAVPPMTVRMMGRLKTRPSRTSVTGESFHTGGGRPPGWSLSCGMGYSAYRRMVAAQAQPQAQAREEMAVRQQQQGSDGNDERDVSDNGESTTTGTSEHESESDSDSDGDSGGGFLRGFGEDGGAARFLTARMPGTSETKRVKLVMRGSTTTSSTTNSAVVGNSPPAAASNPVAIQRRRPANAAQATATVLASQREGGGRPVGGSASCGMGYAAFRQMMAKRATAASATSASPKATAAATTVPLKPQSERQSASGVERSEYECIRATLVLAQPPSQNSLINSSEHKSEHERATAGAEAQFTSDKVVSGSERECASTAASANSETSGIKRKSPPESTELPATKAARQVRRPSSSTSATAAVPSPHACSEDGGRPYGWSASCGAGYSEFRQKMAANSATAAVPAPPKIQMEVQISSNVEHKSNHESTTATADVNLPGELLGSERKSEHEATAETADAQLSIENHSSIGSEQQSERESATSTAEIHLRGENPLSSGNEHKIEREATQASANAQLPSETGASGSELDREYNKGREATADAAQMPAENRLSDESERKNEERKSTAASAGVQMPSETIVVKRKREYDIEITAGSADGHLHSPVNSPQATTTTPNPKVRSPEGGGRPAEWSASCGMG